MPTRTALPGAKRSVAMVERKRHDATCQTIDVRAGAEPENVTIMPKDGVEGRMKAVATA